jgi:kumamolisin
MNLKKNIATVCMFLLSSLLTPSVFAAQKAAMHAQTAAAQPVSFDVYLPLQHRDQLQQLLADQQDSKSASYHHWLKPEEFNARFAASAGQIAAIQKQLGAYGLTATVVSAHRLHVTGNASSVEHAFGTSLRNGTFANGRSTVVATQPLTQPDALIQANAVVTGLSGMIRMRSHAHATALPQNRYSPTGGYWFDDLKQAYDYPSYKTYTGRGVTIGILMEGGFNQADMDKYFAHEKLATPSYSEIDVNGATPYDPANPANSFETHLDMQQSGGMAPNAKVVLYNIPDLSDDNIMAGLSQIISDNKADVVNMSFGGPELFYTAAFNDGVDFTGILREEDDLFAQGNAQGITFVASSGDSGALAALPLDCFNFGPNCGSFLPSAEFPASSPHVTGVGGTNLITTYSGTAGDLNSAYVRESAFADPLAEDIFYGTSATGGGFGSGGGDSIHYRKPLFQALVNTGNKKFRTVPDLSLHMGGCPVGALSCGPDDSYDIVALAGNFYGVVGTSASSPDFAGLTARAVQRYGSRMGNENYYIYYLAAAQALGLPLKVFHTGIPGFNGLFPTTPKGYNRVLGNGTMDGRNFLLAPFIPAAGIPQTPSNP